jgi:hypothetical protein
MRMWMTSTSIMCRQHLIAEHLECSAMLLGILRRKYKVEGFIKSNAIEIASSKLRHDELVDEMLFRGYKHNSPYNGIPEDLLLYYKKEALFKVDRKISLLLLLIRCPVCRALYTKQFPEVSYEELLLKIVTNPLAYSKIAPFDIDII